MLLYVLIATKNLLKETPVLNDHITLGLSEFQKGAGVIGPPIMPEIVNLTCGSCFLEENSFQGSIGEPLRRVMCLEVT